MSEYDSNEGQLEDFQEESPQQLGPRLQVVQPRTVWALFSLLGLIFVVFLWSIFGRIPISIEGQGMLIRSGSVREVESIQSGPVSKILVRAGEEVSNGQVLAYIAQPTLERQIAQAKEHVLELKNEYGKFLKFGEKNYALQESKMRQEKSTQQDSIRYHRSELASAQSRLKTQKELYKQGLITKDSLDNARRQVQSAKENLSRAKLALKDLSVGQIQREGNWELDQQTREHAIHEAEHKVETLEADYKRNNAIIAPVDGRILEVRASPGDIVRPGMPIVNIELKTTNSKELIGVGYFRATDGKRVQTNMKALIVPSTVKQEEFGYLIGKVNNVSKFPATRQGMLRVLHNEDLVNRFLNLSGSAPTMINIHLNSAAKTPSGYEWSSGEGPDIDINAGTLCDLEIITKWQRPITIILPVLTKLLGE